MNRLFFVIVSISVGSGLIHPLMNPVLFSDAGFFAEDTDAHRIRAYSLVMAAYAFGMIFGHPIWGALSNWMGAKNALNRALVGSIVSVVICLAGLLFTSFYVFLFGRLLDGLMAGRRTVVLSMLSAGSEDSVDVFRRAEIMNAVGLLIGPIVSGALVLSSPDLPLYYYSGPLVAMFLLLLLNLVLVRGYVASASDKISHKKESVSGKSMALLERGFNLYVSFFLFQLGWYQFFLSVTPYLNVNLGLSSLMVGTFFFVSTLLYIFVLAIMLPWLKMRLSGANLVHLAFIVGIFSLLSLWLWGDRASVFFISSIGVVSATALVMPLFIRAISNLTPPSENGVALGVLNALIGLAWLSATLLNGYLTSSHPPTAFALAAFCFLVAALLARRIRARKAALTLEALGVCVAERDARR